MEDGSTKLSKQESLDLIDYVYNNPPKELDIVANNFSQWIDKINRLKEQKDKWK